MNDPVNFNLNDQRNQKQKEKHSEGAIVISTVGDFSLQLVQHVEEVLGQSEQEGKRARQQKRPEETDYHKIALSLHHYSNQSKEQASRNDEQVVDPRLYGFVYDDYEVVRQDETHEKGQEKESESLEGNRGKGKGHSVYQGDGYQEGVVVEVEVEGNLQSRQQDDSHANEKTSNDSQNLFPTLAEELNANAEQNDQRHKEILAVVCELREDVFPSAVLLGGDFEGYVLSLVERIVFLDLLQVANELHRNEVGLGGD